MRGTDPIKSTWVYPKFNFVKESLNLIIIKYGAIISFKGIYCCFSNMLLGVF